MYNLQYLLKKIESISSAVAETHHHVIAERLEQPQDQLKAALRMSSQQ